MTQKDKGLIKMARNASRYDYEFIGSLISRAESEECKKTLEDMERKAYKATEMMEFDF